jgi:serine/threonine protein kinase
MANSVMKDKCVHAILNDHVSVIKLEAAFADEESLFFVYEYAAGGCLQDLLKNNKKIDSQTIINITGEIINGLEHMHSNSSSHGSLRPTYILFDSKNHVKLSGFRYSRMTK